MGKRSKRLARRMREPWGQCPSCRIMVRIDRETSHIRFHKGCNYRGFSVEHYDAYPKVVLDRQYPATELREIWHNPEDDMTVWRAPVDFRNRGA